MSKKKEEQLAQAQKTAEAARQAAAPQSGYSTADLNSRSDAVSYTHLTLPTIA